ncbi:MAG: plastocyanin/azurin family copper-binding protein [Actinomycetota bacterium]|nr:plastocyanin/azurin family copper-binding protein [Actinomycetota bacterium]
MLAALSTGNKVGLALVGGLFIVFALLSAFVFPRYRPDYPGRVGLPVFVAGSIALFLGMMSAVYVFGREPEEGHAAGEQTAAHETTAPETTESTATTETTPSATTAPATTNAGEPQRKVEVVETEFKIKLAEKSFSPGAYELELKNEGKVPHDLVVKGPGIDAAKTPVIAGGKTAKLRVALEKGEYELYCSVPGHKQLGMDVKIKVA